PKTLPSFFRTFPFPSELLNLSPFANCSPPAVLRLPVRLAPLAKLIISGIIGIIWYYWHLSHSPIC
ncbi:hypothetical protein, partial [Capnocytophaga sp. oral taxon 380]|uniref:hypothetical protein n=1 Tax=Capnocytophaga sp. oral taxon 380 TaxID=712217 RepID=UPI001E4A8F78